MTVLLNVQLPGEGGNRAQQRGHHISKGFLQVVVPPVLAGGRGRFQDLVETSRGNLLFILGAVRG